MPGLEDVDARRIEDVYSSYGYYDARVTKAEVRVKRADRPIKRQRAYVTFGVDEGPATLVRDVEFAWAEGAPVSSCAEEAGLARPCPSRIALNDSTRGPCSCLKRCTRWGFFVSMWGNGG